MNTWLKRMPIATAVLFLVLLVGGIVLVRAGNAALGDRAQKAGVIEAWTDQNGRIYSDLVYDQTTGNTYDLYIPANASKTAQLGVIVFIHGGYWNSGSKAQMTDASVRYAKAGYLTANINYSLITKDSVGITFYSMLDDIEAALRHIKRKTTELGYRVNKLALSGTSAGGHLAMLYAYSRAERSPLPIAFVFQQVGPVDFHVDAWEHAVDGEAGTARLISAAVDKTITVEMLRRGEAETTINSISPLAFVDHHTVPTIIAYAGKDPLILPIHRHKLIEAFETYGVTYALLDYPNSNHSLEDDPEAAERYTAITLEYCKTYFGY